MKPLKGKFFFSFFGMGFCLPNILDHLIQRDIVALLSLNLSHVFEDTLFRGPELSELIIWL